MMRSGTAPSSSDFTSARDDAITTRHPHVVNNPRVPSSTSGSSSMTTTSFPARTSPRAGPVRRHRAGLAALRRYGQRDGEARALAADRR